MFILVLLLLNVQWIKSLQLDYDACGIDPGVGLKSGTQSVNTFPWLGILYHTFGSDAGMDRATTMVILIHRQFVLGSSGDISTIPSHKFRANTKVLLGNDDWGSQKQNKNPGYSVLSYVVHPEFNVNTISTLAIVKLEHSVQNVLKWPVCPPANSHQHKDIFNIIIEDIEKMTRVINEMKFVKRRDCNEFYKHANLAYRPMWPTQPLCAVTATERGSCVWEGGSALVSRDSWGRWHLLGLGVRGPGCGAPSRYVNIFSYLPWIENSFEPDGYLTILRRSPTYRYRESNQYGDCNPMDISQLKELYQETSVFSCDQLQPVTGHYKFVLLRTTNFTCIKVSTYGAIKATKPEVWVQNMCAHKETPYGGGTGGMCHLYVNSTGTLKISFVFTFKMTLIVRYLGYAAETATELSLPNAKEVKERVISTWDQ